MFLSIQDQEKCVFLDLNVTLHFIVEDESSSETPPAPGRLFDRDVKVI